MHDSDKQTLKTMLNAVTLAAIVIAVAAIVTSVVF